MADKYTPYPLPPCPDPEPEPTPEPCPDWSICLPFGAKLYASGGCVYAEAGSPPADGVYGKIVIANGCIIGAEPEDVPLYTGSPCAPQPDSCSNASGNSTTSNTSLFSTGGSTTTVVSCCEPSTMSGNLYKLDAAGKPVVQLSARGGTGLSVTGSGTTSDPLVISLSGSTGSEDSGIYVRSANAAIAVSGSGTRANPVVVTHKTGLQANVNGMTFDAYGHLTSYSATTSTGVTGLVGGSGIDVSVDHQSGINTISVRKQANDVSGNYAFGSYDVEIDEYGRIYRLSRGIDLGGSQDLELGEYILTINSSGSITRIEQNPDGMSAVDEAVAKIMGAITSINTVYEIDNASSSMSFSYTAPDIGISARYLLSLHYIDSDNNLGDSILIFFDGTRLHARYSGFTQKSNTEDVAFITGHRVVLPEMAPGSTHTIEIETSGHTWPNPRIMMTIQLCKLG